MTRTPLRALAALLAVVLLLAPWGAALAQNAAGGPAMPVVVGTGEIDMRVVRFGIGNRPRPGDWVGIQVELTNRSDRIQNVIVRVSIPDAEGDTARPERAIVADPGAKRSVWLYARLPFDSTSQVFNLAAFEAVERPADEGGRAVFVAGRQVGAAIETMKNPVASSTALLGVVGPRAAGLDDYVPNTPTDYSPTGHERIELVAGLRVSELPDMWLGYASLQALAWTGSGSDAEPRDLNELQAGAIREWVRRGGHLVVVLPQVGQSWIGRGDHLLADIMPAVRLRTLEGVSLDPYRKLLTSSDDTPLPQNAVVNILEPDPAAPPYDAIPILSGPDGQAVAVRRIVGTGAVTVIGLDLLNRTLAGMGGFETDILWNRVLGKRLDLMSPDELDRAGVLRGGRQERWFDRDIAGMIAMTGKAASGLLLAFFVFLLYWLAAGPLGYLGLRRLNWRHHAWVGFVLVAGLFTAIAWGGANMIKPRRVQARHLTFIDHVYGQTNQRARVWTNLLLPEYGEQRITIGDGSTATDFHQAVTSWDTPSSGVGLGSDLKGFPDARGYSVDARSPDSVAVPSRSTIRQFQIDWAGMSDWKMPAPLLPEGASPLALGSEITMLKRSDPAPGVRWWSLHGTLVHGLPSALQDVVVIVVPRQGHLNVAPSGALMTDVFAARLPAAWEPGDPLDLAAVTAPQPRAPTAREYFSDLVGNPSEYGVAPDEQSATTPGRDSIKRLTALSFYDVLEPPRMGGQVFESSVLVRRQAAHAWDLSRWFTQPCIIIVGHVVDAETPVPIRVDGERAESDGRTVVRWIYPLPADPPRFAPILQGN